MSQSTASIRYLKDKDEEVFFPVAHEKGVVDSNGTTLETKLGQKQDTLVSGTNIKTINNEPILGSGNISIEGGGGTIDIDDTPTSGSENAVSSGGVYSALSGKQATLISGSNIKTINYNSLVGPGNITIEAEDGVGFDDITTPSTPDGSMEIGLTNGDTITIDLNHNHPQYLKYEYLTSESQMPANPDATTLYLILDSNA